MCVHGQVSYTAHQEVDIDMNNVLLEPARLTDSGRPILSSSQEVERFLYEGVRSWDLVLDDA